MAQQRQATQVNVIQQLVVFCLDNIDLSEMS